MLKSGAPWVQKFYERTRFLQSVQPAFAIISAGEQNRYGHPHQETLVRLKERGIKIYSTQDKGAVMIEVKDGKMTIY